MSLRRLENGSLLMSKGSGWCFAIHSQRSEIGAASHDTNAFTSRWRHQRGDIQSPQFGFSIQVFSTNNERHHNCQNVKNVNHNVVKKVWDDVGLHFDVFFVDTSIIGKVSANIASTSCSFFIADFSLEVGPRWKSTQVASNHVEDTAAFEMLRLSLRISLEDPSIGEPYMREFRATGVCGGHHLALEFDARARPT